MQGGPKLISEFFKAVLNFILMPIGGKDLQMTVSLIHMDTDP